MHLLYDEGIAKSLSDIFYKDIEVSRELTLEIYSKTVKKNKN